MLGGRIKDLVLLLYLYPINKICFVSSFFRPAIGLYFIWLVYSRLRGLRLKNKECGLKQSCVVLMADMRRNMWDALVF